MDRADGILFSSLAVVIAGVALSSQAWADLLTPTGAAWVQAIGTILALFIAVRTPMWTADAEAERRRIERLTNSQIYIVSLSGPMSRLRHEVSRARAIYDGLKKLHDPGRLAEVISLLQLEIPAEVLAALGRTDGLNAKMISPLLLAVNSCVTHNSYISRTLNLAKLRPVETLAFLQTDWQRMDSMMTDLSTFLENEVKYSRALADHLSSQAQEFS